ncbi:hypothetical protein NDU88_012074 [Pleurodeles waltl]|uniref:Uncharacterized protein n=1 Tax=Pleurodeles waltl TaxID=8319 RepID=A0AAV7R564_PLEWA|nr:hypothetical protein NDU88_012074 [Pleurodeles waltl]
MAPLSGGGCEVCGPGRAVSPPRGVGPEVLQEERSGREGTGGYRRHGARRGAFPFTRCTRSHCGLSWTGVAAPILLVVAA